MIEQKIVLFFSLGSIISEVAAAHNCSNHKILLVLWAIC